MTKFFIAFLLTTIAIRLGIGGNWLYIFPTAFLIIDVLAWIIYQQMDKDFFQ